jgi:hypothetical protein
VEGNNPHGGHEYVSEEDTVLFWGEESEPWDGRDQTIVFHVAVSFPKVCVKAFPGFAEGQAIFSVDVLWVHFKFNSFLDDSVHVLILAERSFVSCSLIMCSGLMLFSTADLSVCAGLICLLYSLIRIWMDQLICPI